MSVKSYGRKMILFCLLSMGAYLPTHVQAAGFVPIFPAKCTVSTTSVNFGIYWGDITLASTGTIKVTCNKAATTNVRLDLGQNSASYTSRKMASGVNKINYNLYTSASRLFVWGDGTAGTRTVTSKTMIVYAAIPAGQNVTPGTYSDTVLVTVAW